jgi:hypothetical protein
MVTRFREFEKVLQILDWLKTCQFLKTLYAEDSSLNKSRRCRGHVYENMVLNVVRTVCSASDKL